MLKRLAQVVWWIGFTVGVMGGLITATISSNGDTAMGNLAIGAAWALCCWTLAFVLGGSFWRPPK